jgi:hypothetical protein
MLRIFMILYRAGYFAQPPDSAFYYNAAGEKYLIFPRVAQTSRMAQALNRLYGCGRARLQQPGTPS